MNTAASRLVPIDRLVPSTRNRRKIDLESLSRLADSVRRFGILHPIIVRSNGGPLLEIVAGERRYSAACEAGLSDVPVIEREDLSEQDAALVNLIENIEREDLNPIEEAETLRDILATQGMQQAELASLIGRSQPYIANSLRLLKLPLDIREQLGSGYISKSHGVALVGIAATGGVDSARDVAKRVVSHRVPSRAIDGSRRGPFQSQTVECPECHCRFDVTASPRTA